MPETADSNRRGTLVRICRRTEGAPVLECDWALVRLEPDSGNAVCERNGTRVICERQEFEKLNFPGADDVWKIISSRANDDLTAAEKTWAKLDLDGVVSALLRHARRLDPAFAGVQTIADLAEKTNEAERSCLHSMHILRLDVKRTKEEYDRCPARTAFECDQKDDLLSRWRHNEDQYESRRYRCETLIPAWRQLIAALQNLEAAAKKKRETSP